jgi:hypothetical protein
MKTQRTLAASIKKPEFLVGFEIEGGIKSYQETDPIFNSVYGKKWLSDDDGSLEFDDYNILTVEYKTPPLPEKEAFKKIFEVFEKLNQVGFKTNNTCGFHVNISEKNLFLKGGVTKRRGFCWHFARELQPRIWLKAFRRVTNDYCYWNAEHSEYFKDGKSPNEIRYLDFNLGRGAIAFGKALQKGERSRLEIRAAGNANYTKKFSLLNEYFKAIRKSMYNAYILANR